jgi:protein-arginine kinase activator protein McsA
MTNKMPVVGRRYKIRNQLGSGNGEIAMVVSVDKDFSCKLYFEKSDGVCSEPLPLASFCNICEELPDSNLQETEEIQIKENIIGEEVDEIESAREAWNAAEVHSVGKEANCKNCERVFNQCHRGDHFCCNYCRAGLPKEGMDHFKGNQTPNPVDLEKGEVNKVKWKKHLKAWKELEAERNKRAVMPKPEPKIDMKEERVDAEIEIGSRWRSVDGKVVTIDFVKNNLVVWTYEFNDREQITLSTNKEIFIKDFKELKRK